MDPQSHLPLSSFPCGRLPGPHGTPRSGAAPRVPPELSSTEQQEASSTTAVSSSPRRTPSHGHSTVHPAHLHPPWNHTQRGGRGAQRPRPPQPSHGFLPLARRLRTPLRRASTQTPFLKETPPPAEPRGAGLPYRPAASGQRWWQPGSWAGCFVLHFKEPAGPPHPAQFCFQKGARRNRQLSATVCPLLSLIPDLPRGCFQGAPRQALTSALSMKEACCCCTSMAHRSWTAPRHSRGWFEEEKPTTNPHNHRHGFQLTAPVHKAQPCGASRAARGAGAACPLLWPAGLCCSLPAHSPGTERKSNRGPGS